MHFSLLSNARTKILIIGSLIIAGCAMNEQNINIPIECEILAYGSIGRSPTDRIMGNSTIDPDKKIAKLQSKVSLNREGNLIKAELNSGFGVEHRFTGGSDRDRVEVTLLHPAIDYGQGVTTDTKWRKKAFDSGTYFFFDVKQELVPGRWEFIFKQSGNKICSQAFDVKI